MNTKMYNNHYEMSVNIPAHAQDVFLYADDHRNFSSHMNKSSWMMAGASMKTETDEGKGQKVGSHIKMYGKMLGISLSLDEVITEHEAPYKKTWETIGKVNLLVIDHYRLGFIIMPHDTFSTLKVYIDYNPPQSWKTKLLGFLFGGVYAKWCVTQMTYGVQKHFEKGGK